jgi:hypothetical protein
MIDPQHAECFANAAAAAGRALTHDELQDIFAQNQRRMNRLVREGMSPADAAEEAGRQLGAEKRLASMIEKRSAAENMLKAKRLDAKVEPGKEWQAQRALLTGIEGKGRDLGRSVDALGHSRVARVLDPLTRDLEAAGVLKALLGRDKQLDRDIGNELFRVEDPTSGRDTGNAHAQAIAKILHKYQEVVRAMQNDAGAWIGKQDHYITRQSHDAEKISAVPYETWRDAILPKLDERTFDHLSSDAQIEPFLRETYAALATGVHDTAAGSDWLRGFKGPSNLAKKSSQERVLHFKDADSWLDYNEQFGRGHVADSVFRSIDHGSRNAILMETFGTNPEAMYDGWTDRMIAKAKERGDFKAVKQLTSDTWNKKIFDTLTRKSSIPGNQTLASYASAARKVIQINSLGGTMISSFSDIPIQAAMLRHNGIPLFQAMFNEVKGLIPQGEEGKHLASMLGAGHDALLGEVIHRFAAEDSQSGALSKSTTFFHKWTGLTYWTDSLKVAGSFMLSHNLAEASSREFKDLPPRLQVTLARYGIEDAEWQAIRQGAQKAVDGRSYILPTELSNLPDEAVAHLVTDEADHEAVRNRLVDSLHTYIVDQVREGMTEPTVGGRTISTAGTQSGTWLGEGVRMFNQFKNYTISYLQRTIGRELLRGADARTEGSLSGVLKAIPKGIDPGGVATLIAGTTALGYISLQLKALAAGRIQNNPQTAGEMASLIGASMAQGGGAGIFGDFLLGSSSRFGQSSLDTFLGPAFGVATDAKDLISAVLGNATDRVTGQPEQGHLAAQALTFFKNDLGGVIAAKIPMAALLNTFYGKAAMQYLVYNRLMEMLNPGYLQRYQKGWKQQHNQDFWLSPNWSPEKAASSLIGVGQ